MASEQDFHPDLLALLSQVWQFQEEIGSASDIYREYSGQQEGAGLPLSQPELDRFLDGLSKQLQKFPEVQVYVQRDKWPDLKTALATYAEQRKKLWDTFYHFHGTTDDIYKRIYVHVANPYVDNVPKIVESLLKMMPTTNGFQKFKIAGPGGVGRRDQIIVYLRDQDSQAAVVDSLRELRNLFQPGVPMAVRDVEGLPGVGIADEPPAMSLKIDPGVESFGTYLSKVLYWAVEESWGGDWNQFLAAAATALEVAGIDPMEPHRHARRLEIEELDRRGRIAQSHRKSLRAEAAAAAAAEAEVLEHVYQAGTSAHLRALRRRTRRPAVDAATDPGSATEAATRPVI